SGVTGPRNDSRNAVDAAASEVVILDLAEWNVGQSLQNRLCVWTLQRHLAVIAADVVQVNRLARVIRFDPLPIFFSSTRINNEQQVIRGETINHEVVDHGSFRRR